MVSHSATKLDVIAQRYEAMAEEYHHNANTRAEIIVELREEDKIDHKEISEHQSDLIYFQGLYRATCRKMDHVRQLIALEETHPTSAFL